MHVKAQQYSNPERGFSLVELMVAMVLGLFLVLVIMKVLLDNKQSFAAIHKLSRLQESGRVAINLISTDIKRAGYMGGNLAIDEVAGSQGIWPANKYCPTANNRWGRMVTQAIYGINDARTAYKCIPNADHLQGDILTLRYASPRLDFSPSGSKLYLRTINYQGKIFMGSEQGDPENLIADSSATVHELVAHAYYIAPSGRSCNGAAVPSLWREALNDNGIPAAEELIPGIEHLQVQYGINSSYFNADDSLDWASVSTARIWLLARSECPEPGFTDTKSYTMGDLTGVNAYKPNDNFRRQLYSTVVMLRN